MNWQDEDTADLDTSYDLSSSRYVQDIRQQAVESIDAFFVDKMFWAGGKIPKGKLYTEDHIQTVMEMNVMDALAIAHYCLERTNAEGCDCTKKGWDIKLCYNTLEECARRIIPKCFAGGILLVYLSICCGVDFLPSLKIFMQARKAAQKKED